MIYLIEDKKWRYKIGYSKSKDGVLKRLKALSTANGGKLRLIKQFDGTMQQERQLHRLFKNNRVKGEWFQDNDLRDSWFHHAITLTKMNGTKVLDYDMSEIAHFMFDPAFSVPGVPVLNLKPCKT